jgi:ATP-dependent RNA helicase RhlB
MRFEDLPIPGQVLEGIRATGFTECTPVQTAALPVSLRGKDVAVQAQTGTGKTAVFLITLFSRIIERPGPAAGPSPRALIVAPTRELVLQICAEAERLGRFTGFKVLPIFGGMDYQQQRRDIAEAPDIIVGTPGRLIDYLKQKVYSLRKIEFLVIDEADRMFDMGFISDIRFLLRRMAPYDKRQSMLFSATLSYRVMELCYEHMNLPERIVVTPGQITVDAVAQEIYHVGLDEKEGVLLGVLRRERGSRVLIFVNTKAEASSLERLLYANGFKAVSITGDLPQKKRLKILTSFKSGDIPILVATDVAARGLHVDDVTHVINYDLPQDPEDYVHRIGRTARAGAGGKAITLACEQFVHSLEAVEAFIKNRIPVVPVDDSLVITDFVRTSGRRRRRGGRPQEKSRQAGSSAAGGERRGQRPRRPKPAETDRRGRPSPPPSGS